MLLVDDEQAILLLIKGTLEAFNYQVTIAHDGLEALNLYHKEPRSFDVVITDLMMPSMDGSTLIRYLHRLNPMIRVIATSGLVQVETDPRLVAALLQKPYDSMQLLNTLRQVLDSSPGPPESFPA